MAMLVPRELIEPVKALGKVDWLELSPQPSGIKVTLRDAIEKLPEVVSTLLPVFVGGDINALLQLYTLSRVLSDGPKIVQPTVEQCEALAQIDLKLTFGEYEQPFPAFIVELPVFIRQQLTDKFGEVCPRFVISVLDRKQKVLVITCHQDVKSTDEERYIVFSTAKHNRSIEESLREINADGSDTRQAMIIERIAMNLALLLVRFGHIESGPIDPKVVAQQTEILKRCKSERKRQRARRLLDAAISKVTLSQNVKFYNKTQPSPASDESFGSQKSPHWRRGHFRRARVGAGRTDRKLIFVRPCFINRQHFGGEMAATEYRIRTDRANLRKD